MLMQVTPCYSIIFYFSYSLYFQEVFENTQVSADNFLLYLHQNYPEFFASIEDLVSLHY